MFARHCHPLKTYSIYNGQVFDAYKFAIDLIRSARKSLVLIDNYADESVLMMLSKRGEGVTATLYTQKISPQFQLDLDKYNKQYPHIDVKAYTNCHDRFLIIDNKELYHISASLKDLGRKMFALSKLGIPPKAIMDLL